jgi:hypothetical protein
MKKLVGHGCASESRIPPSVATSAIAMLSRIASPEERDRQRAQRDPARGRDVRVDAREEQGPV